MKALIKIEILINWVYKASNKMKILSNQNLKILSQ